MKIQPMSPGGALQSSQIDEIMAPKESQVKALEGKKQDLVNERNDFGEMKALLDKFGQAADGMRSPDRFAKYALDTSHPEIVSGEILGPVREGSFELEVKDLARKPVLAETGFDSADAEVGFGFAEIVDRTGAKLDLTIEPGTDLKGLVDQINGSDAPFQARLVDTGIGDEPFRLLVQNKLTGANADIELDPDTSLLEFVKIRAGKDLEIDFEGVKVARASNAVDDLVDGLKLDFKQSAPGTKIRVDVKPDLEMTSTSVKDFVQGYNEIFNFVDSKTLPVEGQIPSQSARDLKQVGRRLQQSFSSAYQGSGSFGSLAEIGITTDAKTGRLNLDEAKLTEALSKDYDGVQKLFVGDVESGGGLAAQLSDAVRTLKSSEGVMGTRENSLQGQIKRQDEVIQQRTDRLAKEREQIEKKFSAVNEMLAMQKQQSEMMAAQLG